MELAVEPDRREVLEAEIAEIKRQIPLLPDDQLDAALEQLKVLRGERDALQTASHGRRINVEGQEIQVATDGSLVVGGEIGGNVNHSVSFIRNVYRQAPGAPALDEKQFDAALGRYLAWVERRYGRLNLRGVEKREQQVLSLTLDDVYVSLAELVNPWRKECI